MDGHRARVGCMAWSSHLLSTGSRDKTILQRDVRAPEHWTSRLAAHRSEARSPQPDLALVK
jgi:cell division cycle 20-like protein 1, cofactor of APC complex